MLSDRSTAIGNGQTLLEHITVETYCVVQKIRTEI